MTTIAVDDLSKSYKFVESEDPFGPLCSGTPGTITDPAYGFERLVGVGKTQMEKRLDAWLGEHPEITGPEVFTDLMGTEDDVSPRRDRLDGMSDSVADEIFQRMRPWVYPRTRKRPLTPRQVVACILVMWAMKGRNNGRPRNIPRPKIKNNQGGKCAELEFEIRWCAEKIIELCPNDLAFPSNSCNECHGRGHIACFIFKIWSNRNTKCFLCVSRKCSCSFSPKSKRELLNYDLGYGQGASDAAQRARNLRIANF